MHDDEPRPTVVLEYETPSDSPSDRVALKMWRRAADVAAAVVLCRLSLYALLGILNRQWEGPLGSLLPVVAFGGLALTFAAHFVVRKTGGRLVLALLDCAFHCLRPRASRESWDRGVERSFRRLPSATAAWGIGWFVYSTTSLGGWPGDAIFGLAGWCVGAWVVLPMAGAILTRDRTM